MLIVCQGCGQRVPIPEGYRRNKIQCACGVICAVPKSAHQEGDVPAARALPATEAQSERLLLEEDTPASPPPTRSPGPVGRPQPAAKPAADMRFPCRRCGRLVRRQGECPDCDAAELPATAQGSVPWPSVDEPDDEDEDYEDGSPYAVEGGDEVLCPECGYVLPPASVLCVRCGYHLKKRRKIAKTYQPMVCEWETNASCQTRLIVFSVSEVAALGLGLTGVSLGALDLGAFLASFLLLTAVLAFLLGTFARIELTRDRRGRVRLTQTWRACFFARQPQTIEVRGFEGISSGAQHDVGYMHYLLGFLLLIPGVLPGVLWWYFTIYKVTFSVWLTRDHGSPAYLVYSGWEEAQMKEIAAVLRDATGLHYQAI
jgi:hypothetical protein